MQDLFSTRPGGLLAGNSAVQIRRGAACARLSLRARGDLTPLGMALGLTLPTTIGQRVRSDRVEGLCLGPDEWILLAADAAPLIEVCAGIYDRVPHSLVDISGREVSFGIEGPYATDLITIGCPRDPASIAPGTARRTVFDGATVVLWRDAQTSYRMDVWNSFAPHLLHLLDIGCRELAADHV